MKSSNRGGPSAPPWHAPDAFHKRRNVPLVPDSIANALRILVLAFRAALEGIGFLAQREADRCSRKIEGVSQRIQQVSLVGIGHRIGARTEHHKTRWPTFRLSNVVKPQRSSRYRRRRVCAHCMLEPPIQRARGNALVPDLISIDDRLHQAIEPFTCQARHCN